MLGAFLFADDAEGEFVPKRFLPKPSLVRIVYGIKRRYVDLLWLLSHRMRIVSGTNIVLCANYLGNKSSVKPWHEQSPA